MSHPMAFRNGQVQVEAMQLIDDLRNHHAVAGWITAGGGVCYMPPLDPSLIVETSEGDVTAEIGDWIVRAPGGDHPTVLDPKTFKATYEETA